MIRNIKLAYAMLSPSLMWLLAFLLIPLVLIAFISFSTNFGFADTSFEFSLQAYSLAFSSLYVKVIWQSVVWAGIGTILCLIIAYPLAYFIANAGKWKNLLLLLIMIPFWTNFLILIYAWIILLNTNGVINNVLINIGIISDPIAMLYTDYSIIIGIVYGFLPFMILPIYASIEQLDKSFLEAAEDLGAKPVKVFLKITLPLTTPGVLAGILITFIPALSVFFISDLLTGGKLVMVGNVIKDAFVTEMNWQLGSALSLLLLILVLLSIYVFMKFTSSKDRNLLI